MKMMLSTCALAIGLVCGANVLAAGEPHLHEGDVLPLLVNGQIALDDLDDKEIDFATGFPIFEADFGDFAGGPHSTDDPGYDHEAGQFTPGRILAFKILGPLEFWNGSHWSTDTTATITFVGALGDETDITGSSAAGGTGLIGAFDSEGNLHTHIDMKINAGAATGAYAVTLSLFGLLADQTTPAYGESDPFMFIFNRGLAFEDFETAVGARVVPIPAAVWMFGSALAGMGLMRRRIS